MFFLLCLIDPGDRNLEDDLKLNTSSSECYTHIETSQWSCSANQLTGFYMNVTMVLHGLNIILQGKKLLSTNVEVFQDSPDETYKALPIQFIPKPKLKSKIDEGDEKPIIKKKMNKYNLNKENAAAFEFDEEKTDIEEKVIMFVIVGSFVPFFNFIFCVVFSVIKEKP